ncbi:hypothetical protein C8E03_108174 [Lachnotalea glycerini]|uniref:Uncharacterized protein n=1 Tax=Lachnotalea glycerini TaxID=1763509 RepID=A0A318EK73_9FIRM|nr:hypothetical protein [Lachnotalea glycerini]OYP25179.1 hypothetical protein CG709_07205 [Lachnotalea glycerini]PXV88447.1 hypothetical protein C8E03_108174 [Lachnotalea glycerini]
MRLSNCTFIVKVGNKYLEFDTHEITELHIEQKRVSICYLQDNSRGSLSVGFEDFEIRQEES